MYTLPFNQCEKHFVISSHYGSNVKYYEMGIYIAMSVKLCFMSQTDFVKHLAAEEFLVDDC